MFRLNNKGQTLVMFVVLVPIFLLVFALVYDFGNIVYEKKRLYNINDIAINYASNKDISDKDIKNLINKNDDNINNVDINDDDNYKSIKICKNISGVFKIKNIDICSQYRINKSNNKIERIE